MHQHAHENREFLSVFEGFGDVENPSTEEISNKNIDERADICRNIAVNLYRLRRKRDTLFKTGLFSDPAWDLLLDLYAAEMTQKKICITSACIAAGVPASTGLRWITILIQNGYVERYDDPVDSRRSLLSLTATARKALETLFEQFDSNQD